MKAGKIISSILAEKDYLTTPIFLEDFFVDVISAFERGY